MPAPALSTVAAAAAAASVVPGKVNHATATFASRSSCPGLRPEEMDVLKSALAVIVVKRRMIMTMMKRSADGADEEADAAAGDPEMTKKKQRTATTTAHASLWNVTGEALFRTSTAAASGSGDEFVTTAAAVTTTTRSVRFADKSLLRKQRGHGDDESHHQKQHINSTSNRSNVSTVSQHQPTLQQQLQQLIAQLPLALDKAHTDCGWESHLQHILQLIWRQQQQTGTPHSATTSTAAAAAASVNRRNALCVHVACQLEQAAAGAAAKVRVTDWIRTQLTSFRVPITAAAAATTSTSEHHSRTCGWWWFTVWLTILQAKPQSMSELLAPVLLDLLLLPNTSVGGTFATQDSTATATITAAATHEHYVATTTATAATFNNVIDTTTAVAVVVVKLESIHLLDLLEQALDQAPAHVIGTTLEALLQQQQPHAATHVVVHDEVGTSNNADKNTHCTTAASDAAAAAHGNNNLLSLLPAVNSSWYSTQDMAYDYHCHHNQQQRRRKQRQSLTCHTAGEAFLLGHGLASISERLTQLLAMTAVSQQQDQRGRSTTTATTMDGYCYNNFYQQRPSHIDDGGNPSAATTTAVSYFGASRDE